MQWEYKALAIGFSGTTQLEAELNDMGKDGWELVSAQSGDEPEEDGLFYAKCIFKRPFQYRAGDHVRFTVEGESGEVYYHCSDAPALTVARTLRQAREQQQEGFRGKPGART